MSIQGPRCVDGPVPDDMYPNNSDVENVLLVVQFGSGNFKLGRQLISIESSGLVLRKGWSPSWPLDNFLKKKEMCVVCVQICDLCKMTMSPFPLDLCWSWIQALLVFIHWCPVWGVADNAYLASTSGISGTSQLQQYAVSCDAYDMIYSLNRLVQTVYAALA